MIKIPDNYIICPEDCGCHHGARFDQIECCCPWWCGYEKKEVPDWEEKYKEHEKLMVLLNG